MIEVRCVCSAAHPAEREGIKIAGKRPITQHERAPGRHRTLGSLTDLRSIKTFFSDMAQAKQSPPREIKKSKTRILLVDDHAVVRFGTAHLINQSGDLEG